jgi:hypothetical protein
MGIILVEYCNCFIRRSQWPRGLRRGSTAARLLGSWVRISPGACMSVCCECCVLSGRGLCDGLITRLEESYRVWCDWVWSWSVEKWGGLGPQGAVEPLEKKILLFIYLFILFLNLNNYWILINNSLTYLRIHEIIYLNILLLFSSVKCLFISVFL